MSRALESRRDRNKRAVKSRIYAAAVDLFMEKGYESTTIEEITERADVGRATFFNHYPSKEDVLHEIAEAAHEYARTTFDREFAQESTSVEEKVRRSLERFALIVERSPHYYRTVFLDAMRAQTWFVAPRDVAADTPIEALTQHLRVEQERGALNPDMDADQLGEMLTGIYMYTILNGIHQGLSYSLVDRMNEAVRIFFAGCEHAHS